MITGMDWHSGNAAASDEDHKDRANYVGVRPHLLILKLLTHGTLLWLIVHLYLLIQLVPAIPAYKEGLIFPSNS